MNFYPSFCPFCKAECMSYDDAYYICGTILQPQMKNWSVLERGEVCIKAQRRQIGMAMTKNRLEEQDKRLRASPTEYELLRDLLRTLQALRSDLALRDQRPARSFWSIIKGGK